MGGVGVSIMCGEEAKKRTEERRNQEKREWGKMGYG
jgi:hypothetical protein